MFQIRVEACIVFAPSLGEALDDERLDCCVFAGVCWQDNYFGGGLPPIEVCCDVHLETLTQRRGNVLCHVNHSYDEQLVILFEIEKAVRKLAKQPKAQARHIQLYGIAR